MRIHVLVKLRCRNSSQGSKLRTLGKELDSGNTARLNEQQFPLLNKIYSNPPKWMLPAYYCAECNEFKYSNKYELLTIHLNSTYPETEATVDMLRSIIKELMELTGLTELKGARIESITTLDEQKTLKGLDALPEVSITIGSVY